MAATYGLTDDGYFRDGEQLTNFQCGIVKELRKHDGKKCETYLVMSGKIGDDDLPELTIPATEFATFAWIPRMWGVKPIIYPLPNAERDLRTAIQVNSEPETIDLYTHTGWADIDGKDTYLHNSGGLSGDGNDPAVNVELPHDLRHYSFPDGGNEKTAFRASLNLSTLGPPDVMWPMLLAAYRAVIDETDFAVHLSGKTGTFKSEICSLIQSHWGAEMDARHLPASWSSTANALECQCYRAKDAVIVIDDYVPNGTSWQVRGLQKTADQIIRGQGNQAGRARLSDTSSLQTTYYPRGCIISTGEDVPQGQSIRARLLILELAPGDVDPKKLTIAQDRRPLYAVAMRNWIQWLAPDLRKHREYIEKLTTDYRTKHRSLGHARTPQMAGNLYATLQLLIKSGLANKWLDSEEAARLASTAEDAITQAADNQDQFMRDTEVHEVFLDVLRAVLGGHLAHIRSKSGGIPESPLQMGWTEGRAKSGVSGYKASGPTIGWICGDAGEVYIDQNQVPFLAKHSQGKLNHSRQTLLKRLKESGVLARTDELRQRNTMRVMCGGAQRSVITLPIATVFPGDDNE
jgi:hypothetical protein